MKSPMPARTLLETIRVREGVAPLWPLHMERLTRSALALGITFEPPPRPEGGEDRVCRFEVSSKEVLMSEREVGSLAPLALVSALTPHRGYPHKVAARAWLEAERLPIRTRSADDALFFDPEGYLVEAAVWAIAWWDRETLVFPPLSLGGLPSVARARLGETVRGGFAEGRLHRDEVPGKALVACNAARGVVAVAALDEDAVPANQRTIAIAKRFWNRVDA